MNTEKPLRLALNMLAAIGPEFMDCASCHLQAACWPEVDPTHNPADLVGLAIQPADARGLLVEEPR